MFTSQNDDLSDEIDYTTRQRPYHIEHTSSRPITEVKQC